jgi:hypothetical protein
MCGGDKSAWGRQFGSDSDKVKCPVSDYGKQLPVSDPLHLTKNAETPFLTCSVEVRNQRDYWPLSASQRNGVLQFGSPLTDESDIGKMRHFYPLILFRADIRAKLTESGVVDKAIELLPFTLMTTALMYNPLR